MSHLLELNIQKYKAWNFMASPTINVLFCLLGNSIGFVLLHF